MNRKEKIKSRTSFIILCCTVLFVSSKIAGTHVGSLSSHNINTYIRTSTTGARNRKNGQYEGHYSQRDYLKKNPIRYSDLDYREEPREVLIVEGYMREQTDYNLDFQFPRQLIEVIKHFYLYKEFANDAVMNKWFDCTEDSLRVKEVITLYKHSYIDLWATRGTMHGASALHNAACFHRDTKLLLFLLKNGAPVNILNRWGDTPYHSAVASGNLIAAEILKKWGADVNAKNKLGERPKQLHMYKYRSCRKYLTLDVPPRF